MTDISLFEIAAEYRCLWKKTGGVVVIYKGQVQGWCDGLRDPQNWKPGAIAINEQNNQWIAAGGDYNNGANRWEQFKDD